MKQRVRSAIQYITGMLMLCGGAIALAQNSLAVVEDTRFVETLAAAPSRAALGTEFVGIVERIGAMTERTVALERYLSFIDAVSAQLIAAGNPVAWEAQYRDAVQRAMDISPHYAGRGAYYLARSHMREGPGGRSLALSLYGQAVQAIGDDPLAAAVYSAHAEALWPESQSAFDAADGLSDAKLALAALEAAQAKATGQDAKMRHIAERIARIKAPEYKVESGWGYPPGSEIRLRVQSRNLTELTTQLWRLGVAGLEAVGERLQHALVDDGVGWAENSLALGVIETPAVYRLEIAAAERVERVWIPVGSVELIHLAQVGAAGAVLAQDIETHTPLSAARIYRIPETGPLELIAETGDDGLAVLSAAVEPGGLLYLESESGAALLQVSTAVPMEAEKPAAPVIALPPFRLARAGDAIEWLGVGPAASTGWIERVAGGEIAPASETLSDGIQRLRIGGEAVGAGPLRWRAADGAVQQIIGVLAAPKPSEAVAITLQDEWRWEKTLFEEGAVVRVGVAPNELGLGGKSLEGSYLRLRFTPMAVEGYDATSRERSAQSSEVLLRWERGRALETRWTVPASGQALQKWRISAHSLSEETVLGAASLIAVRHIERVRVEAGTQIAAVGEAIEVELSLESFAQASMVPRQGDLVVVRETWQRQYVHSRRGQVIDEERYLALPERSLLGAAKNDFELLEEGPSRVEVERRPVAVDAAPQRQSFDVGQAGTYRFRWEPSERGADAAIALDSAIVHVVGETAVETALRAPQPQLIVEPEAVGEDGKASDIEILVLQPRSLSHVWLIEHWQAAGGGGQRWQMRRQPMTGTYAHLRLPCTGADGHSQLLGLYLMESDPWHGHAGSYAAVNKRAIKVGAVETTLETDGEKSLLSAQGDWDWIYLQPGRAGELDAWRQAIVQWQAIDHDALQPRIERSAWQYPYKAERLRANSSAMRLPTDADERIDAAWIKLLNPDIWEPEGWSRSGLGTWVSGVDRLSLEELAGLEVPGLLIAAGDGAQLAIGYQSLPQESRLILQWEAPAQVRAGDEFAATLRIEWQGRAGANAQFKLEPAEGLALLGRSARSWQAALLTGNRLAVPLRAETSANAQLSSLAVAASMSAGSMRQSVPVEIIGDGEAMAYRVAVLGAGEAYQPVETLGALYSAPIEVLAQLIALNSAAQGFAGNAYLEQALALAMRRQGIDAAHSPWQRPTFTEDGGVAWKALSTAQVWPSLLVYWLEGGLGAGNVARADAQLAQLQAWLRKALLEPATSAVETAWILYVLSRANPSPGRIEAQRYLELFGRGSSGDAEIDALLWAVSKAYQFEEEAALLEVPLRERGLVDNPLLAAWLARLALEDGDRMRSLQQAAVTLRHLASIVGQWGWRDVAAAMVLSENFYLMGEMEYRAVYSVRAQENAPSALFEVGADSLFAETQEGDLANLRAWAQGGALRVVRGALLQLRPVEVTSKESARVTKAVAPPLTAHIEMVHRYQESTLFGDTVERTMILAESGHSMRVGDALLRRVDLATDAYLENIVLEIPLAAGERLQGKLTGQLNGREIDFASGDLRTEYEAERGVVRVYGTLAAGAQIALQVRTELSWPGRYSVPSASLWDVVEGRRHQIAPPRSIEIAPNAAVEAF